jgi:hypothetical protein
VFRSEAGGPRSWLPGGPGLCGESRSILRDVGAAVKTLRGPTRRREVGRMLARIGAGSTFTRSVSEKMGERSPIYRRRRQRRAVIRRVDISWSDLMPSAARTPPTGAAARVPRACPQAGRPRLEGFAEPGAAPGAERPTRPTSVEPQAIGLGRRRPGPARWSMYPMRARIAAMLGAAVRRCVPTVPAARGPGSS